MIFRTVLPPSMSPVTSFMPLSQPCATALVLGSMPGAASLQARQYYAHPRNHFWPIMARLAGVDAAAPYPQRVAALTAAGIAIWDVLQSCVRPGSLDSSIQAGTRIANDFASFFIAHPGIRLVCFNGAEAEKSYRLHVLPYLDAPRLRYERLPSTSPAHAALTFEQKLAAWHAALGPQLGESAPLPAGGNLCQTSP